MRVNELSKDLQVSNTDILVALKAQGIEKKHSSNLTEEEETNLRHVFINSVHASLSFDDIKNISLAGNTGSFISLYKNYDV